MPAKESLNGQRFERWKVLEDSGVYCLCQCDCGTIKKTRRSHLRTGLSRSCGCLTRETTTKRNISHGLSHIRLYRVWAGVKSRCNNPRSHAFKDYGGRGIKMCEQWDDFQVFLADAGEGKKGWTLERINNNGDYEPMNICWATRKHQGRNKRNNVVLTVQGVTGCVADLCDHFKIKSSIVWPRLYHKWDPESAFTTPPYFRLTGGKPSAYRACK